MASRPGGARASSWITRQCRPRHRELDRRLDELPPRALDLSDRDPIGRPFQSHPTAGLTPSGNGVAGPLPGGLPTVPYSSPSGPGAWLSGGGSPRRGLGGGGEPDGRDAGGGRYGTRPGSPPRAASTASSADCSPCDARAPASRRSPADIMSTGLAPGHLGGGDRDRYAMLGLALGALKRSERRTWRC